MPSHVGRYALYDPIASGGMATVHYGRLLGESGFARVVAIKRCHPHLCAEGDFSAMLIDEARLAARVRHPNVISTLDVVSTGGEVLVVMEYVAGEVLSRLLRATHAAGAHVPLQIVSAIVGGALHGLHAAHEARDEQGDPLAIVHRDVSPQNILVGTDGASRVLDFGVAKAAGRMQPTTRAGQIKGKLAYMAPEQIRGAPVTRQTDVYAAAVVLWEALTCKSLFSADNDGAVMERVLLSLVDAPSKWVPAVPEELDRLVLRGLSRAPSERFATAREMAQALERCVPPALPAEVGAWVESTAPVALANRAAAVRRIESSAEGATRAEVSVATPLATVDPTEIDALPRGGESVLTFTRGVRATGKPAVAGLGVGLLLAVGAVVAVTRGHARATAAPAADESASASTPGRAASFPTAAHAPDPAPEPSSATTWASPPAGSVSSSPPPAPPAARRRVEPACGWKTVVDAAGHHRYTRQCD